MIEQDCGSKQHLRSKEKHNQHVNGGIVQKHNEVTPNKRVGKD